jgi:LacI family transcriptional regulator
VIFVTFCELSVSPVLPLRLCVRFFDSSDALVGAAIRLIRQKACDGLTVKQILVELQTSWTHLDGKFKQIVGRSVHDEIDRVKKKRVCQLLRASDHTLSEIAAQTGYYSVSHLSRAFRKTFGLWPGEFRKRARRGGSGAERLLR